MAESLFWPELRAEFRALYAPDPDNSRGLWISTAWNEIGEQWLLDAFRDRREHDLFKSLAERAALKLGHYGGPTAWCFWLDLVKLDLLKRNSPNYRLIGYQSEWDLAQVGTVQNPVTSPLSAAPGEQPELRQLEQMQPQSNVVDNKRDETELAELGAVLRVCEASADHCLKLENERLAAEVKAGAISVPSSPFAEEHPEPRYRETTPVAATARNISKQRRRDARKIVIAMIKFEKPGISAVNICQQLDSMMEHGSGRRELQPLDSWVKKTSGKRLWVDLLNDRRTTKAVVKYISIIPPLRTTKSQ